MKRSMYLLLAAFGLAGMFSARAAVTNMSVNFDSDTAGYPPAGWDIDAQNGYGLVVNSASTSSPNSLLVANTNAGNSAYAVNNLSPAIASNYDGAVEVAVCIMLAQTNSLVFVSMNDAEGVVIAGVCFNGAGAIQAYSQAGYTTIAANYATNTWYDVAMKYIPAQNKVNVNIGRKGAGFSAVRLGGLAGLAVANTNRSSASFSIQNYGLHDGQGNPLSGTAAAYCDNIVVRQTDNIALNKPYSWNYAPDYDACKESNDVIQLTDGEFTRGPFWYQQTTVGWGLAHAYPTAVTIDLGSDMPIRGAMFSALYSIANEITLPHHVLMLASTNGTNFEHILTDLLYSKIDNGPTNTYYYKIATDTLHAHGRYVRFIIYPGDSEVQGCRYIFTDEIEVYKGENSWTNEPIPGPWVLSETDFGVQRRLYYDLAQAKKAVVANAVIGESQQTQLLADLANAEAGFTNFTPVTNPVTYRAILPLTPVTGTTPSHANILGVHGALAQAAGKSALAAWVVPHLDPLCTTQQPPVSSVTNLFVAAMKGESQPGAINIVNSTTSAINASVSVSGLPGGDNPSWIGVNNVEWVDTMWRLSRCHAPAACALTALSVQGGGYPITIPAGMVRQVWLDFKPATNLAAGIYAGNVTITPSAGSAIQVPVSLRVFYQTFPETPALKVSGFDYTDYEFATPANHFYDLTPANITQFISIAYSKFMRTTWGLSVALPYGSYNSSGDMITQPSTNNFYVWRTRWPTGMEYRVFANVGDNIDGRQRGTAAFTNAVKNWVTFWANHLSSNGIAPSRLCILLVDEPGAAATAQRVIDWAASIQAANTGVKVWEDPAWTDPNQAPSGFWPVCDVLCSYRPRYIYGGQGYENFFRNQHALGKALEFYETPITRHTDPYSVQRLQAWDCFYMHAEATTFFSFIYSGLASSWNEYAAQDYSSTPLYLSSNTVDTAKHMEAIRLSVQDYEYLYQLSNRIVQVEAANSNHPSLPAARELRDTACCTVLGATNADVTSWYYNGPKNRALADMVRIEIGEMLDLLSPVLLEDGFEIDFSKWNDAETTDWDRATNQYYTGSYSAHAGESCDNLISDNLDTSGKNTIRIEFRYRDDDIDPWDEACLELYNGSSYDQRVDIGSTGPEDTWHKCDITITNSGSDAQYFLNNFRIKFEGRHIDSGEHLWIDDVTVSAE